MIVKDPKMAGYLPVAPADTSSHGYLTSEVALRFSTNSEGGREVFLHALGTTATFGRDFGSTHVEGWRLGGPTVQLVPVSRTNRYGCEPYTDRYDHSVLLVERGRCTFSEKLLHAVRAGAEGVIVHDTLGGDVFDYPQKTFSQNLIRPDGADLPPRDMAAISDTGLIFVTGLIGEQLRKVMADGEMVEVQLLPSEGGLRDTGSTKRDDKGRSGEGRLALGQWEIVNLRIVDAGL